jgi:hypothetical protein
VKHPTHSSVFFEKLSSIPTLCAFAENAQRRAASIETQERNPKRKDQEKE